MGRATGRGGMLSPRALATALGLLAVAQVAALLPVPKDPPAPVATVAAPASRSLERARAQRLRAKPAPPREVRSSSGRRLVAVSDDTARRTTTKVERARRSSPNTLRALYRKQFAARQVSGEPATFRWALLVGINDYASPAPDNYGSRQDAKALRDHLVSLGWRRDHIMLLTDRRATAKRIVQAIRWLAAKTDRRSVAVFHYAGHEKPLRTSADGDNEARDVAIWAADNRLVLDGDLAAELSDVRAGQMWIHMATCRARGFDDPGMSRAGRVITYSSRESEYSYEEPSVNHSVLGYFMIARGLRDGRGDANDNGSVSVEEAFGYAQGRTVTYTREMQHPSMVDRLSGSFSLAIPPEPAREKNDAEDGDDGETACDLPLCL